MSASDQKSSSLKSDSKDRISPYERQSNERKLKFSAAAHTSRNDGSKTILVSIPTNNSAFSENQIFKNTTQ